MTQTQVGSIARIISTAQIGNVRLVEVNARANIRTADEAGSDAQVLLSHGAQVGSLPAEDGTFTVLAIVQARVAPPGKKAADFVSVAAKFELLYRLPSDFEVKRNELEAFASLNAVFNAWPYFREFVQATMLRMGLPPIVLPLFRASAAKRQPAARQPGQSSRRRTVRHTT